MTRLAELDSIIRNALVVLGKPGSRRWRVFEAVNGRLNTSQIAKNLNKRETNVAGELAILRDRGLIVAVKTKGRVSTYAKIPELKGVNLRKFAKKGFNPVQEASTLALSPTTSLASKSPGFESRSIARVVTLGEKYGINNINKEWVDALVILNFIETAATKFLMDHGYTEQQIKDNRMHWEDKIGKLEAKLYEEAKLKGVSPRTSVLTVLKNYRTQRNDLDHEAHVGSALIKPKEVELLLKTLDVFVEQIFDEHKKYCCLPQVSAP